MSRRTAILAGLIAALPLACREEPKPVATDKAEAKATPKEKSEAKPAPKDAFEQHLERLKKMSRRVNDVLLTATAEVKDDSIEIKWTLNYDGPRQPLIIQRPMHPQHAFGATSISVFIPDTVPGSPTGAHAGKIGFRMGPGIAPSPTKDEYLIVEKGKTASGKIQIPTSAIRAALNEKALNEKTQVPAGPIPPKELYIQLSHLPLHRGEEFELDAWTAGSRGLYSEPLKISITRW